MSGDLKTILSAELALLSDDLGALAEPMRSGDEAALEQCLTLCERLGQVADLVQSPALQDFAVFLMGNAAAMLGVQDAPALGNAVRQLQTCMESTEYVVWKQLSSALTDTHWPAPMADETAGSLISELQNLNTSDATPQPEVIELSPADLNLVPSEEASADTRHAYFAETPHLAAELSALLARIDAENAAETCRVAQRLVHTIKGSSSLVGLQGIAHLAHALETALQRANNNEPSSFDRDQLSIAADFIELMLELSAEGGEAPAEVLDLIYTLHGRSAAEHRPARETEIVESPSCEPSGSDSEATLNAQPDDNSLAATLTEAQVLALTQSPKLGVVASITEKEASASVNDGAKAEVAPTLNVPVAVIDENLRRAGELNTAIAQLTAHVGETLRRADHLTQQLARVQGQVYELETLVDTRGVPAIRQHTGEAGIDGFDPLEMDEYTALHSLSRAFSESTLDSRELSRELAEELLKLQNLLAQHARLGRELDDSVTAARLVPVATIAPRLERIVRQTARQTHREVQLEIRGRELSIDTDILNGLVEPLMHALRNAIDHGIEDAAERNKAGKSSAGRISVQFKREGNRIEVRVEDDGRGLDFESIARRAHERGLLIEGRPVTERELTQLIFTPGFSTRVSASAISGRGIGMDVVRASVEKLKGTLHIESQRGKGCILLMRLPLSLTSQHTLFVAVGECVYGLPSTTVEQVLYSDAGNVVAVGDDYGFEYAGHLSPLHSLGSLLGHDSIDLATLSQLPRPVVLVRSDEGVVGLVVDRALDSRQTVIKGLSPMLPTLPGVAGAAVLPDGGIGVVLELRELLRAPKTQSVKLEVVVDHTRKQVRRALVVDDSLSARRGLAQLLSDAGYEVATASDGIDALSQMEQRAPDLLVVDMEMPRMNGLELTTHIRGQQGWRNLPIVMITSRAADKHRAQALRSGVNDYVTKPYQETDLMDRLFTLAPP